MKKGICNMKTKKISYLQGFLTILFVVSFLVSNIIATKQTVLPFNITMTSAVVLFPIVYVLSDVFSEVYGYEWSRNTRYIAFAANIFMVIFFEISIHLPSAVTFVNQSSMEAILGSTPKTLFASLGAYLVGDFVNDKIFAKMKQKHDDMTGFGCRAIVSSLLGELVDSCIFLPIIFIGVLPVITIVTMIITQAFLKVLYEVIVLPVTTMVVKKVNDFESRTNQ